MKLLALSFALISTLATGTGCDQGARITGPYSGGTTGTDTDTNGTTTGATGGDTGTSSADSGTTGGGADDSGSSAGNDTAGTGSGGDGSSGTDAGTGGSDTSGNGTTGGSTGGTSTTGLTATHRSGQTFLTWNETLGANYHVYRHSAPITNGNIGSATRLTQKWGPLDQDTSVNVHASNAGPRNFVINDLSDPLREDQGLFVYTTQDGEQGTAYYAVSLVVNGAENGSIITSLAVNESVNTTRPVLAVSVNGGKGRIYTHYMDYAKWNPTFNGYAFNFNVALPGSYNPSSSYPLMVHLHAWDVQHTFVSESEYEWPVIQLFPSDPGVSANTFNTWWYGHAAEHNYKTQGSTPSAGPIENFTEQRVLAAVDFLIADGQFNVDEELVHMYGGSMGGGVLAYGMRYPDKFSGIYANQPMTNYAASPIFQEDFVRLFGEISSNLPIVNNGPNAASIKKYDMTGSEPTMVWDWMNHQEQLRRRRAERFGYLMVDHGKLDTVIDWQTQGKPMAQAFTDARAGFSAVAVGDRAHSWLNFSPVVTSVFGFGYGDEAAWRYPKSLSFPGIHNASGSGSLPPSDTGDDRYNTDIEWSTPRNNFHQNIVDSTNRWELSIRSLSSDQTADITPRRTNSFRPAAGTTCSWTARRIGGFSTLGSGSATVDGSGLLTATAVPITAGGSRLTIECP